MAKILFISNIAKKVGSFSEASIAAAKSQGFEFYYAANWDAVSIEQRKNEEKKHSIKLLHIDLVRNPYSKKNIKAYKQLVEFVEKEKIDYIHCNTPVGGLLGRIVGKKCKVKKVIYQAHGFHFYKGAPKINWLIYYPIEKWLAHKTDAIITINKEDYALAQKNFRLRNNGKAYYVPGVGIDTSQYKNETTVRTQKRHELGIPSDAFVLISVGELNKNKNNKVIIDAMYNLPDNVHYVLCGEGTEEKQLKEQSAAISNRVHFLGYRTDIKDLLMASDVFILSSFREGLSRSIMEAMASGMPCVVSKIRGNVDLIDTNGGRTFIPDDANELTKCISDLLSADLSSMGEYNKKIIGNFDTKNIIKEITEIYKTL